MWAQYFWKYFWIEHIFDPLYIYKKTAWVSTSILGIARRRNVLLQNVAKGTSFQVPWLSIVLSEEEEDHWTKS
jgi:hypothetical protein